MHSDFMLYYHLRTPAVFVIWLFYWTMLHCISNDCKTVATDTDMQSLATRENVEFMQS